MKTRILRVVWLISVFWLALIFYGGTLGTAKGELLLNIEAFGWPSFIGLLICYFSTGSFLWPKEISNDSPIPQMISDITTLPEHKKSKSVEDNFLENIERSKSLVATELESSRNALEEQWKNKHFDNLQRITKLQDLIKKSDVIESCLFLVKETYHWNSWIENQQGQWHYPEWISNRLVRPSFKKGDTIKLESYNPILDEILSDDASLQTAFAFKSDGDEIAQYLYLKSDFEGAKFGRLLIKVNEELVLDVSVSNDIDDEYYIWHYRYGEIHFAKLGNWISKIVNLQEEFKGQEELERTAQYLKAQEHKINKFS